MGRARIALVVVALVLVAAAAQAARAQPQRLPDLVEARVNVSDHTVTAGDRVTITDVVLNRGTARAPASVTHYWLVVHPCLVGEPRCLIPERKGDVTDLGSRNVHALRTGRRSLGHHTAQIPGDVRPGTYFVVACADAPSAIDESDEQNNCRTARHPVRVRSASSDLTPPEFAGLESAITCVGGPVGGGRKTSYTLKWKAATDDVTPQKDIVYDIYQATAKGAEDFSNPTYTSDPGATEYKTPPLSTSKTFYFVVRARDRAGNRDSNEVERQGENPCV